MQKMQPNQGPKLTPEKAQYLATLMEEKGKMDSSLTHANRILSEEIDRVQTGRDTDKYVEIHTGKPSKMKMRILIPVKDFPKYNFVGKLLGPKGATLKQIQEDTGTKMSILGKGSIRDKKKEEELRKEGGKYNHLNDELHLNVDSFATPSENYRRFSMVVDEISRYLIPDEQELFNQQAFGEQGGMFLNGENGGGQPGGQRGGRGRGRGGPGMPRGRGGAGPAALLGSAPSAGRMAGAGSAPPRGGRGRAGASLGGARPAPPSLAASRQAAAQAFEEDPFYQATASYEDPYGAQSYGAEQDYADPYDQGTGDTQYFDYGHGSSTRGEQGYEDYADQWGTTQSTYGKSAAAGGRPRGGATDRLHPYGGGATRTARY